MMEFIIAGAAALLMAGRVEAACVAKTSEGAAAGEKNDPAAEAACFADATCLGILMSIMICVMGCNVCDGVNFALKVQPGASCGSLVRTRGKRHHRPHWSLLSSLPPSCSAALQVCKLTVWPLGSSTWAWSSSRYRNNSPSARIKMLSAWATAARVRHRLVPGSAMSHKSLTVGDTTGSDAVLQLWPHLHHCHATARCVRAAQGHVGLGHLPHGKVSARGWGW